MATDFYHFCYYTPRFCQTEQFCSNHCSAEWLHYTSSFKINISYVTQDMIVIQAQLRLNTINVFEKYNWYSTFTEQYPLLILTNLSVYFLENLWISTISARLYVYCKQLYFIAYLIISWGSPILRAENTSSLRTLNCKTGQPVLPPGKHKGGNYWWCAQMFTY